jgi:DHA1 family multidrug resistance protein-like MFS transporter
MKELFRDTTTGHVLRLLTKGRILQYEEDKDPSLWQRYIDKEKSGRMAHHGHTGEEEKEEKDDEKNDSGEENSGDESFENDSSTERPTREERNQENARRSSSDTRVGTDGTHRNEVSGVAVDPEKGRDVSIVTWYGENDPEVCNLLLNYPPAFTDSC